MTINISKCAALSVINGRPRKYVESYTPTLQGSIIRALKWDDRYKYLGVEVGRRRATLLNKVKKAIVKDATAICSSLLTDWQKVEAINIIVVSQATYYLDGPGNSMASM